MIRTFIIEYKIYPPIICYGRYGYGKTVNKCHGIKTDYNLFKFATEPKHSTIQYEVKIIL